MASDRQRPAWLWPWRPSEHLGRRLLTQAQALADRLGSPPRWFLAGALAGTLPLMAAPWLGLAPTHALSGLLLGPLLVAAAVRDDQGRGFLAMSGAFGAHSAVVLALTAWLPATMGPLFPPGEDYWAESRAWIVTGRSREYELAYWLPAHARNLAGTTLFSYLSLGFVTFWQGFKEVDLMNYYVGHLAAESDGVGTALALGWHPWSLCRGAGYLALTFEIASWSFERLTATPLSTRRRRGCRWAVGLALLVLDGALKFLLLEPVRRTLEANLS